ncbi:helix-turn-helix domain-containing protein [Embleya sp. NPDC050154]|uniref:helix-turn-helix domain-containing protein n=1 Tax=Embleya sp. NPDC050154 TaxID=3363988 RepID=UPI0037B77362
MDEVFAAWMRADRKRIGWSQQRIADATTAHGRLFHQTQIAKIERGDRKVSLAEAADIAAAMGSSLAVALGYAEEVPGRLERANTVVALSDAQTALTLARSVVEAALERVVNAP